MATTQAPSSTRLDPKIRYYIHRTHGNAIVPLIPADQLPFYLKDFPQNMNHRQLSEGGWKFLEETSEIPFPLALLSPHVQVTIDSKVKQTLRSLMVPTNESPTKEAISSEQKSTIPTISECPTVGKPRLLTDSMTAMYTKDACRIGYTKPSTAVSRTVAAKKRDYCYQWVKTGACVYAKKGCWYKHEMPSLEKLKEMGLIGLPKWFQERTMKSTFLSGKEKREVSTSNKTGKQQIVERYGVYTTNTADEPMLMDMNTPERAPDLAKSHIPITEECSLPSFQPSISAPEPTETGIDASRPSTFHRRVTSESSMEPTVRIVESLGSNSIPPNTIVPTAAPTKIQSLETASIESASVSPSTVASASTSEPAPKAALKPIGTSKKNRSTSPDQSPQTQSPRTNKSPQKPFTLDPAVSTPTPVQTTHKSQSRKIKTNLTTKGPTSPMVNDEPAKLTKVFTKRKVSAKKGCKAHFRQCTTTPVKKVAPKSTDKRSVDSKVSSTVVAAATQLKS